MTDYQLCNDGPTQEGCYDCQSRFDCPAGLTQMGARVHNQNPCGYEATDLCFDCHACSQAPGKHPAVTLTLGNNGFRTRPHLLTVIGPAAQRLQDEYRLNRIQN